MSIVYRKDDKYTQDAKGKAVTYVSGNGIPKAVVAYINKNHTK